MESGQKDVLRRNHVSLVQDLEPRGGVLNSLYEDGVLTENDCERIREATTRKERCQLLLHLIPTRGPGAYGSFQRALQSSRYDFLAELLEKDCNKHDRNGQGSRGSQQINGASVQRQREQIMYINSSQLSHCDNCDEFINMICTGEDAVESEVKKEIARCGGLILDNVEPNDVVDQLFQDEILDADEIDEVRSGVTRRQRCENLLKILVKTSPNSSALNSLVKSLRKKYRYIANKITNTDEDRPQNSEGDETSAKAVDSRKSECMEISAVPKAEHANFDAETKAKTLDGNSSDATRDIVETGNKVHVDAIDGGHVVNFTMTHATNHVEPEVPCVGEKLPKKNKRTEGAKNTGTIESTDVSKLKGTQSVMCKDLAVIPTEASHKSRRLTVAFNYLSTLINQGEFDKYETVSARLRYRSPENYDMLCIIGYLNASRDLFRTDFDSAKMNINSTMQIVPKTSNPRYFILELFTAKTRMYITQKKLEKLQNTLDEAMMILETDPGGCTGRAAGWLYINDARNKTAQMSCLNLSKPNALKLYESLFVRAKTSFQRAMNNFKMDGGKDGPFGFGYALCRLVILLLRCGDNGMTMGVLTPPEVDVKSAGHYLQHLEDSDVGIPKILDVHFLLAKCDYQYRRANFVRGLQHAQAAYDLAVELNMLEFTEHANNRVKFLRSVAPLGDSYHDVMSEDDIHDILFNGQSTDHFDTSQSE